MNKPIHLYPKPKSFEWLGGGVELFAGLSFHVQEEARQAADQVRLVDRLRHAIAGETNDLQETQVRVVRRPHLHAQGYVLQWNEAGILFEYNAAVGLHYALVSLEQLVFREGDVLGYFRMEDEPEFSVRGLMLDIGRNKIPKMETLFSLIDQLAQLKINHLQLYMEGFSYEYQKYKENFPDGTPMTAEEFRQLDQYAASRFIDLVPNQNCLGHMADWLTKPEFRELAEHPDGMPTPYDFTVPPTTLNPVDSRSIDLIKDLFNELLPQFSSSYVNVDMDEPFGLGTGQSKGLADEIGLGNVYLNFAEKVFDIARNHEKKILMWGDFLTSHPELLAKLPEDVSVLDWNYDSRVSFEEHCRILHERAVPFYVCPGTSSWSSISGRTDNMLDNISDAAIQGMKYGAEGLVVTDWGDAGHWQVSPMSYPGYIYAAGVGWQVQANLDQEENIQAYASACVFRDQSGVIGQLLMDMGRYYHLENSSVENATYTNHILQQGLMTREELEYKMNAMMTIMKELGGTSSTFELNYQYKDMLEWVKTQKEILAKIDLHIPDAETVKDELANTLRLIEQGIGLHRYIYQIDIPDLDAEIFCVTQLKDQLESAITEFNRLWLIRNREGGLRSSTGPMYKLLNQYKERLEQLQAEV